VPQFACLRATWKRSWHTLQESHFIALTVESVNAKAPRLNWFDISTPGVSMERLLVQAMLAKAAARGKGTIAPHAGPRDGKECRPLGGQIGDSFGYNL
jgi:hypothetical protein